jgi:hypothetical protein
MASSIGRAGARPLSERQVVVFVRRRVIRRGCAERRIEAGRRRWRSRASRRRLRIWTRRAIARRPDHSLAARPTSLTRLVLALEVGRARIALAQPVVPHGAATDRTRRHSIGGRLRRDGAGCGDTRAGSRRGDSGSGAARRPDHSVALTVLALEVGRLRVALPFSVVPHRPLTPGTGRSRGLGVGLLFLFGHGETAWKSAAS